MDFKNYLLDYVYKIQTVEMIWPRVENEGRKAASKNFGIVSKWKKKK